MIIKRFLLLVLLAFTAGSFLFAAEENAGEEDFSDLPIFEADEGLTITASPETTQQMRVVTDEDIRRSGAADIASLLEQILNLPVTRHGPYGNAGNV
ncbi:MAG: hypothetical protein LBU99_05870, partial [Spirochaetaceae bacterium]|nr:hypothetical protein [Spirochaetaceae bacterium]